MMKRALLSILFLSSIPFVSVAQPLADNVVVAEQAASVDTPEAEESEWEFWWGAGINIASNYMWRGFDQSYRGGNGNMFDPSFQPSVTLGYGKFYLDFWGNASLLSNYKELDITLGFEHENLAVTLYDVYCGNFDTPFFDKRMTSHSLTATIDYTLFDRLRLHWATTFLHADDYVEREDGTTRRAFSSYFEVAYTQPIVDLFDIELTVGASPWTAPFYCFERDMETVAEGFNFTNLSVMFNKEFERGDLVFPVQLGYVYNPTTRYHYAILKAGFNF